MPSLYLWFRLMTPVLGILSCTSPQAKAPSAEVLPPAPTVTTVDMPADFSFAYDLTQPSQQIELPPELLEVSGLSWAGEGTLAMIHDEGGVIFHLKLSDKSVQEVCRFAEKGDYEGLEIVGNSAWALRSNGLLMEVKDYLTPGFIAVRHETGINPENDSEGLGYDATHQQLLIACKAQPKASDFSTSERGVFSWSLRTSALAPAPRLRIKNGEIRAALLASATDATLREKGEKMDPEEDFQPSSIAIHPLTGDLYLCAAAGQLLVVYGADGKLKAVKLLPKKLFPQPEGLCFDSAGTLFISNEGKEERPASVLQFDMKP